MVGITAIEQKQHAAMYTCSTFQEEAKHDELLPKKKHDVYRMPVNHQNWLIQGFTLILK